MRIALKIVGLVGSLCLAIGVVALYGLYRSSNEIERIGVRILPTVENLLVIEKSLESIARCQQVLINPYVDQKTKQGMLVTIRLQTNLIDRRLPNVTETEHAGGSEDSNWKKFKAALDEWKAHFKKLVELYQRLSEAGIEAPENLRAKLAELQGEGRLWAIALALAIMERKDFLWEVEASDSEMWNWREEFVTKNNTLRKLISTDLVAPMERLYSSGGKVVEIFKHEGKSDQAISQAIEVFKSETVPAERELASVFDKARAETQQVRELYAQIRAQAMGACTISMDKTQSILKKLVEVQSRSSTKAVVSAKRMAWILMVATGGCAIIAFMVAVIVTQGITKPLSQGVDFALSVQQGDLTKRLKVSTSDEAGQLASALNDMADDITEQNNRVKQGVDVLLSVSKELASIASDLVAGSTETLSALSQTITSVEQIRQSARVCNEQAKSVSDASREAVKTSESGKSATSDTKERMNVIHNQMETIGETVVTLSSHTEAIEGITATVQDLADQSRLLAVNASIEAARAGEQGKGFTVVAHAIKTLSDQSREATDQVQKILQNIRDSVSDVVMATEQGGKAVQDGVEQSAVAGQSIEELASNVQVSAQAARVIDKTTEQQFLGMDQIAEAMADIEQTVRHSLDRSSQLEGAAQQLTQASDQLKTLLTRYRVD